MATANLQSIHGKHKLLLEQQARTAGYQVLCSQETKEDGGAFVTEHLVRLGSQAQNHWVSQSGSTVLLLRLESKSALADVSVVSTSPRLLAVVLQIGRFGMLIISAHFPYQTEPQNEAADARQQFLQVCQKYGDQRIVVAGVDANARLRECFGDVTGSLTFDEPDDRGMQAAELFQRCGLFAPSTCSDSTLEAL